MANNNQAIVLRPGVTGSIRLDHTGNYQVMAQTRTGQIDRNDQIMSPGELDRMVITESERHPHRCRAVASSESLLRSCSKSSGVAARDRVDDAN